MTRKFKDKKLTISILIPCHNEEVSIAACLESCIKQSRPAEEIIVINDGSTDNSLAIIKAFLPKIKIVNVHEATGNKSYAQEIGLKYVNTDIFIATDGDTLLDKDFVKNIEKDFYKKEVAAVGGYVKSLRYNWLTSCRAYDYCIGQNLNKLAQDLMNFIFVIPGAAGAFRKKVFDKYIKFNHDTLTEDLDFTYELHKKGMKIKFDTKAIVYTQDPANLKSYLNQMRRWYGGGWQNLIKHSDIILIHPIKTLELSLIYIEGFVFSLLFFLLPILNIYFFANILLLYFMTILVLSIIAAIKEKRSDILLVPFFYLLLIYINAWVFLEQFIKEVILRKKNLKWFTPDRIKM